jgi:chemotaxis protein methyltransferase CheR
MTISNEQFDRVRHLSQMLAGIAIHDRHRELIARRCLRLSIKDPATLDALLCSAERGDPEAQQRLIKLLTTSHTGFFRNPRHFEIAAGHALRAIQRRGKARLWSAAAATGEEPYSLAMALISVLGRDDPPPTVLATDINSDVLSVAQRGEYDESALRSLEPGLRALFFAESAGAGRWRLAGDVRRMVEFRPLNLASSVWPVEGPFDVVLCRNVLMYLDSARRESVVGRLVSLMAPDGLLVLDPAEHLGSAHALFGPGNNGVFALRSAAHLIPSERAERLSL